MTTTILLPLSTGRAQATTCLESIASLPDAPAHDVIIVDNAGADLGDILARLEGDVTIVRAAQRAPLCQALNAALEAAPDGIVAAVTNMVGVEESWLAPLVAALEDPGVAAATSVVGDAGTTTPAAAAAVAWRRADLPRIPDDVPDAVVVAAICAELASTGCVMSVPASRTVPPRARQAAARTVEAYGGAPELSIVIPTLDAAGDRLRRCVAALQTHTDVPHEIIVVDNGAPPQGFTAPVNSGIRAARGRYIAVCNDDVEVLAGWWGPLVRALDGGAAVVFPLTVDGFMRDDFAAWCFGLTRDTVERFGVEPGHFLDPELVVWYQDTDLLVRLQQAGVPPRLVEASHVRHGLSETVASDDAALRAWIDQQIVRDKAAFERRHGALG